MMNSLLCVTIRFLQPYCHARAENGEPEWPPSPLRLMQAIVAGSAGRWNDRQRLKSALPTMQWLETLPHPKIIAPAGIPSTAPCQFYVPDNSADLLVPAWKKGDFTKQPRRTDKVVRPIHLAGDTLHYLYPLRDTSSDRLETLTTAARSITHLGWGIDIAIGDASVISGEEAANLPGRRWMPCPNGSTPLRVPKPGTLNDLVRKHEDFLGRIGVEGFRPVPPLRFFDIVYYRCDDEPPQRPYRLFELRSLGGSVFRYPHRRLVHLAGMVRHLSIKAMQDTNRRPRGVGDDWVETFVTGHRRENGSDSQPEETVAGTPAQGDDATNVGAHRQLSYIPLPSIGFDYTDPGVRRMMLAAPIGDDVWLDHLARRLAGQALEPLRGDEFAGRDPPILVPLRGDNVTRRYTEPDNVWHSVTPIILPGHDDHKPEKTRALICKALRQSGVEQPCEFEWSAFSRFPKAYSAHKYGRGKQPQGYIRPGYLLSQTAVHLTVRFNEGPPVPGPIAIGAGRHCGFGLMARLRA